MRALGRSIAARVVMAGAGALIVMVPGRTEAAVVPIFVDGDGVSFAAADHRPDASTEAGRRQGNIAYNQGSATTKAPYNPSTLTFPGGNTVAKAGIGRSESVNRTSVNFASGSGISQNDPNHTQPTSELIIAFRATWVVAGGDYGPPLTSTFSVPVGAKVNSKGSASFFCDVHWDANLQNEVFNDFRAPFTTTRDFGPGTSLVNITAPAAPFAVPRVPDGSTISLRGTLRFRVNNDDGPALIEFPTLENFPELAGRPDLQYEPGITYELAVPEPSSAALVAIGVAAALARRRGRAVGA